MLDTRHSRRRLAITALFVDQALASKGFGAFGDSGALAVTDETEKPQALNQLYRRLRDETYELGIGYVNIPWAVGPRVQEWRPFAFSFFPSGMHTITLK